MVLFSSGVSVFLELVRLMREGLRPEDLRLLEGQPGTDCHTRFQNSLPLFMLGGLDSKSFFFRWFG